MTDFPVPQKSVRSVPLFRQTMNDPLTKQLISDRQKGQFSLTSKELRYGSIIIGWSLMKVSVKKCWCASWESNQKSNPYVLTARCWRLSRPTKSWASISKTTLNGTSTSEISTSKASKHLHIILVLATSRGCSTTGPTTHLLRSNSLCPRILMRYLAQQPAKIPIEEYRNDTEKCFTYHPIGNTV